MAGTSRSNWPRWRCRGNWSKEFLEAGKKRLQGDTAREATSHEVTELRHENAQLKQLAAEVMLRNRVFKKSLTGSDLEKLDT